MTALVTRFVGYANLLMSANMHNYTLFATLQLWWICCLSVLIWPNPIRLDLALYVGGTMTALLGVVGGMHTYKAVKGVESSVVEPKPDV